MSDSAADARLEMYEFALEDIPPWAVDMARRRWARRDVPSSVKNANFSFAPSPGDLRAICLDSMAPYQGHLAEMRRLLSAVTLERAMDPTALPPPPDTKPLQGPNVRPMLRKAAE
jgi:hypothetical protein